MQFDPENPVFKLCAKGMESEAKATADEAASLFLQAWDLASNDFEKFTAAHYVARHQKSTEEKLRWDKLALEFALRINEKSILSAYPSLYLNIAKCYEDLNETKNALENYKAAFSYIDHLPDDAYGKMIRSGIENGIERVSK